MAYDLTLMFALVAVMAVLSILLSVGLFVWGSFAMMALFKKAGYPQPWAAWVPYYREFVFFEIGGQTGWFMFLSVGATFVTAVMADQVGARWGLTAVVALLVTAAALVFWILAVSNVNRAMNKHLIWFTLLGAVLPLIWLSIVAWDRSSFDPLRASGPKVPGKGDTFLERVQHDREDAGRASAQ